jgi:hypothetical protein
MSYNSEILTKDIMIEFSNHNGHVRLTKETYRYIDKYRLKMDKGFTKFNIEYSADAEEWSTCASYPVQSKNIHHQHFHDAVKALNEGTKIKPIQRY